MPSRQQLKQLQLALINAFPSKSSLERLLYYELEKNLNEITKDSDLQEIVFNLIRTAETQGWLIDLVQAARKENPGNSELAAIALELLSSESYNAPKRSPSNSVTVVQPKQEQEVQKSSGITAEFDVFLAYNSADKLQVKNIAEKLKQRGLKPWLDEEQIPPGRPFQDEIQQAVPLVKSAAIFLGQQGLGRWQGWELRSLITQCVDRQIPVIPVLLPGVNEFPKNLLFLQEFSWVSFSNNLDDEQALSLLQWGITGQKPEQTVTVTPQPSDNLSSEKGVDYTRLRDLLKAGFWKDADYETYLVMLQVVGREKDDWIRAEELLNFPCTDLRTIDGLWVKYSNGRFGFSVQKKIYLCVGGIPDGKYYQEAWEKFGDRVGWRKGRLLNKDWIYYEQVTFSTSAPRGHLPIIANFRGTQRIRMDRCMSTYIMCLLSHHFFCTL